MPQTHWYGQGTALHQIELASTDCRSHYCIDLYSTKKEESLHFLRLLLHFPSTQLTRMNILSIRSLAKRYTATIASLFTYIVYTSLSMVCLFTNISNNFDQWQCVHWTDMTHIHWTISNVIFILNLWFYFFIKYSHFIRIQWKTQRKMYIGLNCL